MWFAPGDKPKPLAAKAAKKSPESDGAIAYV
jgi:hypothetical protein